MSARRIDLTGKRFGRLVVKSFAGKNKYNSALWLCKCDCGKECVVNGSQLRCGDTRSCGCLHSEDLTGMRFGRLLVVERLKERTTNRHVLYKCKCDCGEVVKVSATDLKRGHTRSCGCLMKETTSQTFITHGATGKRLYTVWEGMRARCNNPNHIGYKNYGGRGIKVCEEWNDYSIFEKWAVENGYDETAKRGDCTIDRVDNNGNYEPSNCRWVDMKIQAHNRRLKGEM